MTAESDRSPEARVAVWRFDAGVAAEADDVVAVEEPLEIRIGGRAVFATLRTPGHDFDLARGLLYTEGLVADPLAVAGVAYCADVAAEARGNVVVAALAAGAAADIEGFHARFLTSACGMCGSATLAELRRRAPPVAAGPRVDPAVLALLPERLRAAQTVFARTGGLHGAALFDARGALKSAREDVGRHNAVDKVIGEAMRFGALPLADSILLVSGRAGFEIVQKARVAGIPIVAAISAPSSLAIELARDGGQTLVGLLRGQRMNVYCGRERVESGDG